MKRQLGFSLSDLLISLALSSLLLGSLFQCYLSGKKIYVEAEALLNAQFDLQWISDMLSDSIRRAGFTPCLSLDKLQVLDRRTGSKKIAGIDIIKQGIAIHRMSENFSSILEIKNLTQIEVDKASSFNVKQPIIISNCNHAEIHEILSLENLPHSYLITLTKPLLFDYNLSYAGLWLEEKWIIKKNLEGKKALYYQAEQTEELSSVINSLTATVQDERLVEVILGLDNDTLHKLMVVIRT